MASDENLGKTAGRPASDDREGGGTSTLLPMLIGGLALITVGMIAVAMFV